MYACSTIRPLSLSASAPVSVSAPVSISVFLPIPKSAHLYLQTSFLYTYTCVYMYKYVHLCVYTYTHVCVCARLDFFSIHLFLHSFNYPPIHLSIFLPIYPVYVPTYPPTDLATIHLVYSHLPQTNSSTRICVMLLPCKIKRNEAAEYLGRFLSLR